MLAIVLVGFLGVILSANWTEKNPRWKTIHAVLLLGMSLAWATAGVMLLLTPLLALPDIDLETPPASVGIAFLVSAAVLLLLFLPPIRRILGQLLPLHSDSWLDFTAVQLAVYLGSWSIINLLWVGGVDGLQESAETVPVYLVVIQGVGFVSIALLGTGWLVRRDWGAVLARLGLSRPDWQGLAAGAGAVILLLGINFTISIAWALLDPERSEALGEITDILFGDFDSFATILLLAVVSGISEELLFRGALQPRLGLPLTSLLFASVHLQYAITPATLVVLVIGVVLGLLRRHFGTWSAVLAHFGYNFSLLVLGLLAPKLLELLETAG